MIAIATSLKWVHSISVDYSSCDVAITKMALRPIFAITIATYVNQPLITLRWFRLLFFQHTCTISETFFAFWRSTMVRIWRERWFHLYFCHLRQLEKSNHLTSETKISLIIFILLTYFCVITEVYFVPSDQTYFKVSMFRNLVASNEWIVVVLKKSVDCVALSDCFIFSDASFCLCRLVKLHELLPNIC